MEPLETTVLQKRSGRNNLFVNIPENIRQELGLEGGLKAEWIAIPNGTHPLIIIRIGWPDAEEK